MAYAAWSVIAGETPTATKWNILGTNDAYFDAEVLKLYQSKKGIVTLTDGATVTIDGNAASSIQSVTIAGNRALAISNMTVGQGVFLRIVQGTGGSRLITSWFSGSTVKFPGGAGAPPLSTAVGAADGFLIICVATDTYEVYFGGFGLA